MAKKISFNYQSRNPCFAAYLLSTPNIAVNKKKKKEKQVSLLITKNKSK